MNDVRVILALAALCVLALGYVSAGVKGALAPLCAVATASLWLALFGAAGLLVAGGWALYAGCLVLAGGLVWRHAVQKKPLPMPGPGFWFFVAAGTAALVLLWARQPMFLEWDDFSLWGTAGKLTKLYNQLYTTAPVGFGWNMTQNPATVVFGYFFQFFGSGYSEWQAILAADVFQLAALAGLLAPFTKKQWSTALPIALVALLIPFLFSHYPPRITLFSPVYASVMVDVPMGLWFGAALVCGHAGQRRRRDVLPLCLALATLTLVKDMGLMLALVAAVVLLADGLFTRRKEGKALGRHVGGAFGRFGLSLGCVVLPYALWQAHISAVARVFETTAADGGTQVIGTFQMPFVFLAELFSPEKSERFITVMQGMPRMFFAERVNMFFTGAGAVAVCLALVALAALFAREKARRRRCIVFGAAAALGFLVYYLLVAMSYIYIFRADQVFVDYRRYVSPYYMGWMMGALLLLGTSVGGTAKKKALAGRAAILALATLLFARTAQLIPAGRTVLGVHRDEYSSRRVFAGQVAELQQRLDPGGKTFLVISDDTGLKWFMYCYELLPWQVDYSYGGGELLVRTTQADGSVEKVRVTAQALEQRLIAQGCTTLYIDNADEDFRQRYAALFEDGMAGYFEEGVQLYRVDVQDGRVVLRPAQ